MQWLRRPLRTAINGIRVVDPTNVSNYGGWLDALSQYSAVAGDHGAAHIGGRYRERLEILVQMLADPLEY